MYNIITLENGLKVILNQNNNKYRTTARIYIKSGGLDNEFILDNKKYSLPHGTAHFLEHYLIEHSIYGNILEIFSNDYISSNGITTYSNTEYYISTVHDFEENFIKLLNIVNKPKFDDNNIEMVRKPIIQEIKKTQDRPGREFMNIMFKNVFKNKTYGITLGDMNSINKINIDTLKTFHKAFYRPSNQIIVITGNFKDNIIDIIKEEYSKFNFDKSLIIKEELGEPKNTMLEYNEIFDSTKNENYLEVTYKLYIGDFTPLEKNKIDYYFSYLFYSNFSENSKLFSKLLKEKLTIYSVDTYFNSDIINNFLIISLRVYTSEFNKVIDLLKEQIDKKVIGESMFFKWKNNRIIDKINLLEDNEWVSFNLINNILLYDLYEYDSIDFIKSLNVDECKDLLNRIDYSNYTITVNNTDLDKSI